MWQREWSKNTGYVTNYMFQGQETISHEELGELILCTMASFKQTICKTAYMFTV